MTGCAPCCRKVSCSFHKPNKRFCNPFDIIPDTHDRQRDKPHRIHGCVQEEPAYIQSNFPSVPIYDWQTRVKTINDLPQSEPHLIIWRLMQKSRPGNRCIRMYFQLSPASSHHHISYKSRGPASSATQSFLLGSSLSHAEV
jgi:hypothetical protein